VTGSLDDAAAPARPAVRPTQIPIEPKVTDSASDAEELTERVAQVAKGGARAAVLGINDGLVTNICLILAVAGANASRSNVRLAGFASLVAGAFSMAAGEWVSVRSQVELLSGLVDELRRLVSRNPHLILDELAKKLEQAGFGRETAQTASTELPLDEPRFLNFAASTLFGINPDELGGSPMTAAVSSFATFALGAFVPLLPWFITSGVAAVWASILLTAVASIAAGGVVARSSGRPMIRGALRQLAIVVAASAVTYGIGKAFGTTVG